MNAQIASFTTEATYSLTICSETGTAVDCSCPDMKYRGHRYNHQCKHMLAFQTQLDRAARFILLQREIAEKEANARRAAINALYNPNNIG